MAEGWRTSRRILNVIRSLSRAYYRRLYLLFWLARIIILVSVSRHFRLLYKIHKWQSLRVLTSVIPRSTLTACERRVVQKLIDCCEPGIKGNLLLKLIKLSFMMDSRWISNNLVLSSLASEKMCSMASIFKLAFNQASSQRFCFALTCPGTCFHENLRRDLRHKE